MLKTAMGAVLGAGLCLFAPELISPENAQDVAASLQMLEHRRSDLDLEIAGDFMGATGKTARYIPREELLKLAQVTYSVNDDANFAGTTEISGVLLSELTKAIGASRPGQMIVAICVDQYHAHYTAGYLQAHRPLLVLKVNGKAPAEWPTNAVVRGAAMGPYLISHEKFIPGFKVRAHEDEAQIPWGVVRLEFRNERSVLGAIAPRGPQSEDEAVKDGFVIAQQNCFRCHDDAGQGGAKSGRPWPVLAAWAEAS